ncbi:hypothetical protein [Streptomyces sp. 147326]|uniref:hypothetical protein n=1 Tax=Streptomyces sp. 147326 TaxID=3074379 RepID=UPI003857229E
MNATAVLNALRPWEPARRPAVIPIKWAWPAYASATLQLIYAGQKGYYAVQGRLGIPGGPSVPASQYAEVSDVALAQWTLASLGLLSAVIALAAVRPWGGLVPRPLLLLGLWGTVVPAVAGQIHVAGEVLFASGPAGWSGGAAVQGFAGLGLWLAMAWFFTRRRGHGAPAAARTA